MTSKHAARGQGGLVMDPPISQAESSVLLGVKIPDAAWQAICFAFAEYGSRAQALAASKASKSNGDTQSWFTRQKGAGRSIERAMGALDAARTRHGDFLEEASDNLAEASFGHSAFPSQSVRGALDHAYELMLRALTIVERAEPQEIETPTAAQSRDLLVRDVRDALRASGLEARLSSGFDHGQLERVKLDDLTAFERLIAGFGIGVDKKLVAFSAWLRGALSHG